MAQNDKKFCLTPCLRDCTSYDCGFCCAYVKWWYFQIFFHFSKILLFWVSQSSSINTKNEFWGVPHLLHMCVIFWLIIGIKTAFHVSWVLSSGCITFQKQKFFIIIVQIRPFYQTYERELSPKFYSEKFLKLGHNKTIAECFFSQVLGFH